ncbi:MAG: MFS transporter [Actinobacteria bacterium]|nr:MFS transporter [Actinomycetota bacterium]
MASPHTLPTVADPASPTSDATSSFAAHQQRSRRTLASAAVFAGVGIAGTTPAGSLLITDISGSEHLAGLTQTFGLIGAATASMVLVRLTERGGRQLALRTGYLVGIAGAITAITAGAARSPMLLLLGALMVGWAVAAGFQARFAAVDLAAPEHRARDLSVVVWGSTVGAVLGPNLLEPSGSLARLLGLPELTGPYIIAIASLLIAAGILTAFLRPDPYLLVRRAQAQTATTDQGSACAAPARHQRRFRTGVRLAAANPSARLGISAVVLGHVAMVSIMVMTPVHMKHVDVSLTVIGLVISVHIAGMYALSPVIGWLADRVGRAATIACGAVTLISAAVIAGTAADHDSWRLGFGLLLLGVGWSMTLIAGSTLLSEESIPSQERTAVQGTSDLVMSASAAAGGAVAGVIIAVWNYLVLCLMVIPALAALLVWAVRYAGNSAKRPDSTHSPA